MSQAPPGANDANGGDDGNDVVVVVAGVAANRRVKGTFQFRRKKPSPPTDENNGNYNMWKRCRPHAKQRKLYNRLPLQWCVPGPPRSAMFLLFPLISSETAVAGASGRLAHTVYPGLARVIEKDRHYCVSVSCLAAALCFPLFLSIDGSITSNGRASVATLRDIARCGHYSAAVL